MDVHNYFLTQASAHSYQPVSVLGFVAHRISTQIHSMQLRPLAEHQLYILNRIQEKYRETYALHTVLTNVKESDTILQSLCSLYMTKCGKQNCTLTFEEVKMEHSIVSIYNASTDCTFHNE